MKNSKEKFKKNCKMKKNFPAENREKNQLFQKKNEKKN